MRKNSDGFTLVEMLVALGLTGLTLLVVGTLWFDFAKKFKQIAFKSESRLDTSIAQQMVRKAIEEAAPSMLYADVKIKTHCSDYSEPCVRKLEGTQFVNLTKSPFSPSSITHLQFFRDETGSTAGSTTIFGGTVYDWRKFNNLAVFSPANSSWVSAGDLYATYPLILGGDPFFMIKLQSNDFYFESSDDLNTFTAEHGEFRLQGTPPVPPSQMPEGQLYLLYNPEDSERHYTFRYLARSPAVATSTNSTPRDHTLYFQNENHAPPGWPSAIADQIGRSKFSLQPRTPPPLSTLKEIRTFLGGLSTAVTSGQKIYAVPVILEAYYLEVAKNAMPPGSKINLVRSRYAKSGDLLVPPTPELILPDIPNIMSSSQNSKMAGPSIPDSSITTSTHRRVYFFRKLPGKTLGIAVERQ